MTEQTPTETGALTAARCLRGILLGLIGCGAVFLISPWLHAPGVSAAPAESAVRNGGMEERFAGGVASMWANNSYGDADVTLAEETDQPRSGRRAQRLVCRHVTAGGAQIRQLGISVRAGQRYTLTAWLRGRVESPVYLGLRQNGKPYQSYLSRHVRVGPRWRRYTVSGVVAHDDPAAGLFIAFGSPGELVIDDVEVREGEAASIQAALPPARKGNLLYNSSFELGRDGWGPVTHLQTQASNAVDGSLVARCAPGNLPILLESRPVVIRPGQRYTVSASLKAAGPAEVELVLMEYADEGSDHPAARDAVRKLFAIDEKWQRVSLSGVLEAPLVDGYVLQLNYRSGARAVWADAIQWEEGDRTPYRPAALTEATVRAVHRLLAPGQPATTGCQVYQAPSARSTTVSYRLEDFDGRKVAERVLTYDPKSKIQNPKSLTWSLPRPGIYRVVAVPAGTPVGRTGQAILCRLTAGRRAVSAPRLGIHSWIDAGNPASALETAGYLGAGQLRLHDFRSFIQWNEAEPRPGQYVWFDRDLNDVARRGYGALGTLCRTPLWAAQVGDRHQRYANWSTAPPRNWDEWARYVEAVAGRYRSQIQEWEVWNEPWAPSFWTGTTADYVQMLAVTRRAVKSVAPDATIVGGCFSPEIPRFTREVLDAGGLDSMDVVSYHEYMTPERVADSPEGGEPVFFRNAAALHKEIRRRGGRQPLWCTETGVPCPSFYSWLPAQGPRFSGRAAVATLVKGLALLMAAGVERTYYYHVGGMESNPGYAHRMLNSPFTLLDYDGAPKPILPALAQAAAMLGDTTDSVDLSTPALRAYAFHRPRARAGERYVAVVWARGDAAPRPRLELTGPAAPVARDAMGAVVAAPVTLSDQPVYLLAGSREALAHAVRMRR